MRVAWILMAAIALALAGASSTADAKWAPAVLDDGGQYAGPLIGPDPWDSKGGADPDEPLGPERLAIETTPTIDSESAVRERRTFTRFVQLVLRLGFAGWVAR
jgi:hypothetical protein